MPFVPESSVWHNPQVDATTLHRLRSEPHGKPHPFLTDITGNRRWLPFEVKNILSPYDYPLDYEGLYSQVMHLRQSGFAYCFDTGEIRSLAKHVNRFEAPNLEEDQIRKHFRIPNPGEAYEVYSVADVLGVINLELKTQLSATKVGMLLNKMGFKKVRSKKARGYMVCRYTLEEISKIGRKKWMKGRSWHYPFRFRVTGLTGMTPPSTDRESDCLKTIALDDK